MAIWNFLKETIVKIFNLILLWASWGSSTRSSSSARTRRLEHSFGDEDDSGIPIALRSDGSNSTGIVHSYRKIDQFDRPTSSFSTKPPQAEETVLWTRYITGDLIGTESGVHMISGEGPAPWETTNNKNSQPSTSRRQRSRGVNKRQNIPPPITLLQGHQGQDPLPWSLTREYVNGRLILKEALLH